MGTEFILSGQCNASQIASFVLICMLSQIVQINRRAAVITAHRLSMKASGFRVSILPLALRTHRKLFHRSPDAVVGHPIQDREPRSAVRTVNERMQIPPVARIEKFTPAGRAYREIRGDKYLAGLMHTLYDTESLPIALLCVSHEFAGRIIRDLPDLLGVEPDYGGNCRGVRDKATLEFIQDGFLCLRVDLNVRALITDVTSKLQLIGKPAHEGPESDSLNDTVYTNL